MHEAENVILLEVEVVGERIVKCEVEHVPVTDCVRDSVAIRRKVDVGVCENCCDTDVVEVPVRDHEAEVVCDRRRVGEWDAEAVQLRLMVKEFCGVTLLVSLRDTGRLSEAVMMSESEREMEWLGLTLGVRNRD